jgi:hypothetical protein
MSYDDFVDDSSPEAALRLCGWREESDGSWAHPTTAGRLLPLAEWAGWRHWQLTAPLLTAPRGRRCLHLNSDLVGPAKYVTRHQGSRSICRVDAPHDWRSAPVSSFSRDDIMTMDNPWHVWAQAVTACAMGARKNAIAGALPLSTIAEELKRDGWPASLDDGQLVVHVQLRGLFRQIYVQQLLDGGVIVRAKLIELSRLPAASLRAILHLALEANTRLPLVHMAIDASATPPALWAEVHLGSARVPGAWLMTAVEVVANAVTLTARELQALRDPELAQLVLAAQAA